MKKSLLIALSALMSLSLVACSSGNSTGSTASTSETKQETKTEEKAEVKDEITYTETTVVDNDTCTIVIKEINDKGEVSLMFENKAEEKTIMFSIREASVNGVQFEPLVASEVAPGKKANSSFSILASDLKKNGIDKATNVRLVFYAYDYNDWTSDPVVEEEVFLYPYGEDKAVTFEREAKDTDQVLVDNENISVVLTDIEENGFWGYTLNIYVDNKTDKTLMIATQDSSVNGYMVDPFFAKEIWKGTKSFAASGFSKSQLQENGIETVEDIEFTLVAYDSNDWMSGNIMEEKMVIKP